MMTPLVLLWLFTALHHSHAVASSREVRSPELLAEHAIAGSPEIRSPELFSEHAVADPADALYHNAGLAEILGRDVFDAAYESVVSRGLAAHRGTLAIADMSQPSTARRMVLIDLTSQDVILQTYVAHGQGTGGLMAERFSNVHESHQTSLGLYRVGIRFRSPQHGPALLLHGLDAGVNDQARAREIIIHGADYVSAQFIEQTGRLGRSWGCPAVPRADMALVSKVLADGGLLYVYGG